MLLEKDLQKSKILFASFSNITFKELYVIEWMRRYFRNWGKLKQT